MLEEIHATTEDRRVTRMILSLSTAAFAMLTIAVAAM
jgi:hypothetical protein